MSNAGTVSTFDVVMFAVKKNATETDAKTLLANTTVRSLIGLYKEMKTVSRHLPYLAVDTSAFPFILLRPMSGKDKASDKIETSGTRMPPVHDPARQRREKSLGASLG